MSNNVFDQIKGINLKEYNYQAPEYKGYVANINFSFFPETIFFANEINKYVVNDKHNYDFYYYALPKKKRYSKWIKTDRNDDLQLIAKAYRVNKSKAQEILPLLTDDDIKQLKEELHEGGRE